MESARYLDVSLLINMDVLNVLLATIYCLQEPAKKKDWFLDAKNIDQMAYVKNVLLLFILKTVDSVFQWTARRQIITVNAFNVWMDFSWISKPTVLFHIVLFLMVNNAWCVKKDLSKFWVNVKLKLPKRFVLCVQMATILVSMDNATLSNQDAYPILEVYASNAKANYI